MWGWFRKSAGRPTRAPHPAEGDPDRGDPPAGLGESEAFTAAWNTLEAAPEGVQVLDRHPLSPSEQTLVDLLHPLLRDHFQAHPPSPAAFPAVAVQVLSLLEDQDPQVPALLHLISQDPAISMHVLQVANSAYYDRGRKAQDLPSAVLKMGVRGTGEAVVVVAGRSLFDPSLKAELEVFKARMRELYRSAMTIAFAAREHSERSRLGLPHQLFLAGMFHDIGHTLALRAVSALMIAGKVPRDLPTLALDALLERTHVEMGTRAHALWNLPAHLAALCAQHHDPEVPAWVDRQDLHVLRIISGLHRLLLDPNDPSHAAETRQSLRALEVDRPGARALFERIALHREVVTGMLPA